MDGNGSLYGNLSGNTREIIHKFSVDLPKKHGRGGQSALRFARLRLERRHTYVSKVAELATQVRLACGRVGYEFSVQIFILLEKILMHIAVSISTGVKYQIGLG